MYRKVNMEAEQPDWELCHSQFTFIIYSVIIWVGPVNIFLLLAAVGGHASRWQKRGVGTERNLMPFSWQHPEYAPLFCHQALELRFASGSWSAGGSSGILALHHTMTFGSSRKQWLPLDTFPLDTFAASSAVQSFPV